MMDAGGCDDYDTGASENVCVCVCACVCVLCVYA